MINQYAVLGNSWVAITSPGQSGTCWLDEDNDGAGGAVDVRIVHSVSGVPDPGETTEGKRLYKPSRNDDLMIITADTALDVYYAKCANAEDTAILSADVI